MGNRIITISREFGSGGRTVGREVAKRLGIPCYDQELIDKIAEKSGYDRDYIRERGEYTASGSWLGNALAMRDFYGQSDQDKLWAVQLRRGVKINKVRLPLCTKTKLLFAKSAAMNLFSQPENRNFTQKKAL